MSNVAHLKNSSTTSRHDHEVFEVNVLGRNGRESLLATGIINEVLVPITNSNKPHTETDVEFVIIDPATTMRRVEVPTETWMVLCQLNLVEEMILLATLDVDDANDFIEVMNLAVAANEWQGVLIEQEIVNRIIHAMINFDVSLMQKLVVAQNVISYVTSKDSLTEGWERDITSGASAQLGLMHIHEFLKSSREDGDAILAAFRQRSVEIATAITLDAVGDNTQDLASLKLEFKSNNVFNLIKG